MRAPTAHQAQSTGLWASPASQAVERGRDGQQHPGDGPQMPTGTCQLTGCPTCAITTEGAQGARGLAVTGEGASLLSIPDWTCPLSPPSPGAAALLPSPALGALVAWHCGPGLSCRMGHCGASTTVVNGAYSCPQPSGFQHEKLDSRFPRTNPPGSSIAGRPGLPRP